MSPLFYINPMRLSIIFTCHRSETPPTTAPAEIHSESLHFWIASRSSLSSLLHSNAIICPLIHPMISGVPRSENTLPCMLIALQLGKEFRYLSIGVTTPVYSSLRSLSCIYLLALSCPFSCHREGFEVFSPTRSPTMPKKSKRNAFSVIFYDVMYIGIRDFLLFPCRYVLHLRYLFLGPHSHKKICCSRTKMIFVRLTINIFG